MADNIIDPRQWWLLSANQRGLKPGQAAPQVQPQAPAVPAVPPPVPQRQWWLQKPAAVPPPLPQPAAPVQPAPAPKRPAPPVDPDWRKWNPWIAQQGGLSSDDMAQLMMASGYTQPTIAAGQAPIQAGSARPPLPGVPPFMGQEEPLLGQEPFMLGSAGKGLGTPEVPPADNAKTGWVPPAMARGAPLPLPEPARIPAPQVQPSPAPLPLQRGAAPPAQAAALPPGPWPQPMLSETPRLPPGAAAPPPPPPGPRILQGDQDPAGRALSNLAMATYGRNLGDNPVPLWQRGPVQADAGGLALNAPGGGVNFLMPVLHPDGRVEVVSHYNPMLKAAPMAAGALGMSANPGQMLQEQLTRMMQAPASLQEGPQLSPQEAFARTLEQAKKQLGIMSPDEQKQANAMELLKAEAGSKEKIQEMHGKTELEKTRIEAESRNAQTRDSYSAGINKMYDDWLQKEAEKGNLPTAKQKEDKLQEFIKAALTLRAGLHPSTAASPAPPNPVPAVGPNGQPTIPEVMGGGPAPAQQAPAQQAPPLPPGVKPVVPVKTPAEQQAEADEHMRQVGITGVLPQQVRQAINQIVGGNLDQGGVFQAAPKWQNDKGWFGGDPTVETMLSVLRGSPAILEKPEHLAQVVNKILNMPGAPTKEQLLDQFQKAALRRAGPFGADMLRGRTPLPLGNSGYSLAGGGSAGARQFQTPEGITTYQWPADPLLLGGLSFLTPTFSQSQKDIYQQELQKILPMLLDAVRRQGPTPIGQR